jgi:phosphoglycerate kinase
VTKLDDCVGPEIEQAAKAMSAGDVLLLENLRFHAEEEKNDAAFARNLASLAELYVNDAFGTSHRAHASVVGVTAYLPAVAGLLLEKEIRELSGIIEHPAHPFAAVLGGAKVSDKVSLIVNIMDKVDDILVGGGMAATFLKAKSYETGTSLLEAEKVPVASELMVKAACSGVNLVLPTDVVLATEISATAKTEVRSVDRIPKDSRIVDIGPATIESFRNQLRKCKTVFWNGPMGIYEIPQFAQGTKAIAEAIAILEATTVIGGGSTADAVADMGLTDQMTFVSTGGGASLEFLSGNTLPGIAVIPDKET